MTVEFADFEISDYLDDEKVIAEYLLAAADDPDPEVLSRAKSDVVKARAANSIRKAMKAMEPLPKAESYSHAPAIVNSLLILTIIVQIILVKIWTYWAS
jgi:DNA-binding phage protein